MAGAYQPGDQERADVPTPADDHDPHDERLRRGRGRRRPVGCAQSAVSRARRQPTPARVGP
jgi:hypothetical protein